MIQNILYYFFIKILKFYLYYKTRAKIIIQNVYINSNLNIFINNGTKKKFTDLI